MSLSHPDNILEIQILITPLHIIPEWYFLIFYMILKAIPNIYTGFIYTHISIFYILLFITYNPVYILSYLFTFIYLCITLNKLCLPVF